MVQKAAASEIKIHHRGFIGRASELWILSYE